jgi:hypothetical protein
MENKSREAILDIFSQILLERSVPNLSSISKIQITNPQRGIGPFAQDDDKYSIDLRPISKKGSLSYLHPIYVKSSLMTITEFETPLSNFDMDLEIFKVLYDLKQKFKNIVFSHHPTYDFEKYNLKDFHLKKKLNSKVILLDDFLFSSCNRLFEFDLFNYTDCDYFYLDLGLGLCLCFSNKSLTQHRLSSFHSHIIPYFFNFIDTILINQGKGRIYEINKIMDIEHSYGLNFKTTSKISDMPFLTLQNQEFINLPSSILDEHITFIKREIYGK